MRDNRLQLALRLRRSISKDTVARQNGNPAPSCHSLQVVGDCKPIARMKNGMDVVYALPTTSKGQSL
jgi:hypothetical protein